MARAAQRDGIADGSSAFEEVDQCPPVDGFLCEGVRVPDKVHATARPRRCDAQPVAHAQVSDAPSDVRAHQRHDHDLALIPLEAVDGANLDGFHLGILR